MRERGRGRGKGRRKGGETEWAEVGRRRGIGAIYLVFSPHLVTQRELLD